VFFLGAELLRAEPSACAGAQDEVIEGRGLSTACARHMGWANEGANCDLAFACSTGFSAGPRGAEAKRSAWSRLTECAPQPPRGTLPLHAPAVWAVVPSGAGVFLAI